jgi:hypothetical protein
VCFDPVSADQKEQLKAVGVNLIEFNDVIAKGKEEVA